MVENGASSGQFIFHWSTEGLTTGKYRLYIDLGDGVTRTVACIAP